MENSNGFLRFTPTEVRFATAMTRLAVRMAEQSGDSCNNQQFLWRLMTEATHRHPKTVQAIMNEVRTHQATLDSMASGVERREAVKP